MIRHIKLLAAAGALLASASVAGAAPTSPAGQGVTDGLTLVRGCHASCERDARGWHRHAGNNCRRRACRQWRGQGRRPDSCVKVGPVFFCDY